MLVNNMKKEIEKRKIKVELLIQGTAILEDNQRLVFDKKLSNLLPNRIKELVWHA